MEQISTRKEEGNWWTRPCGARQLLNVALPLIISTGSWSVMHFCDRMFLSWHDRNAMAAALPAGILHFLLICFPIGVTGYVNTFVAQYYGSGRLEGVGRSLGQGLRIGFFATPLYMGLAPLAPFIFGWLQPDAKLCSLETVYFQVLTWGAGAAILCEAFTAYYAGRGRTKPVMVINVLSVVLNIVLDYGLIFGNFGLPELGIVGAAWGTVAAQWSRVVMYLALMRMQSADWHRFGVAKGIWDFDAVLFRRILRFGGPNGVQLFVEIAGFTILVQIVTALGQLEAAATTLAFTINNIAFLPLLGMSIAVSTLVGQQIGRHRPDLAERVTWTAFSLSLGYTSLMAVLYIVAPGIFLAAQGAHADPVEFGKVYPIVVVLLRFVAVYAIFDAANLVFVAAIRGAGDTRFVMFASLVLSSIAVCVVWIGTQFFEMGQYGCWTVFTIWVCMLGVTFFLRFRQGKWRSMRVIEHESHGEGVSQAIAGPDSASVAPKST